jgi:hypothetical protein
LKLDHGISGNKNQIFNSFGPLRSKSKRLAIFATYGGREMDRSDLEVLRVLKERKYFVCLVTNSDSKNIFEASENVDHQIIRKNVGFDLAAYRDAINLHGTDWESVFLINDSIYWPVGNFSVAISQLENLVDDSTIVGLTDSYQRSYHLQSFCFLASGMNSINRLSGAINKVHNWRYKRSAVAFGELRITSNLIAAGAGVSALFSYDTLSTKWQTLNDLHEDSQKIRKLLQDGVPLNSTQHFWRALLGEPGGFLKRSLVSKNPAGLNIDTNFII